MHKKGLATFNPRAIGGAPRLRIRIKSCDCAICAALGGGLRASGPPPIPRTRSKRWRLGGLVQRPSVPARWRRLRAPPPAPLSVDPALSISSFNPDDWDVVKCIGRASSFASTSSTCYVASPTHAAPPTLAAPAAPAPVPGPVVHLPALAAPAAPAPVPGPVVHVHHHVHVAGDLHQSFHRL